MTANRRSLLVFAVGVSTGFLLTYLILSATRPKFDGPPVLTAGHQVFLPNSPHSTGETDHFAGPDKEQRWDDFHADNHHDEDTVAQELSAHVRVLCWVMTSPGNLQSKARHVKATWGRRCNKLLFMSSKKENTLPAVGLPVPEGRDHLWGKTKEAFRYIHAHHLTEADWFLKADDDTYVVLENLRRLLRDHDPTRPLHLGRRFKPYVTQGYMSGGAGYILSKEAVRRFVEKGIGDGSKCRQDDGGAEDLEMGQCLQRVGVTIIDSRDALGRETFHPFVPEHHLIPGLVPKDNWYWKYNYYPAKEGPACCSDFAITFHYVPPNMMYVFEYFIYHLKPFGIDSKIVIASEKYQPELNMPRLPHHEKQATHGIKQDAHRDKPTRLAAASKQQTTKVTAAGTEQLEHKPNQAFYFKDSGTRTRVRLVPRQT